MIVPVSDQEFQFLKEVIRKKTEIFLGDNKKYLVENRLSSLVLESGCKSFGQFCSLLEDSRTAMKLMDKIVEAITTNETYWFRDEYPFAFLKEVFLPDIVNQVKTGRRNSIRIWSAAASYGQEAYSIAMTIREFLRTQINGRAILESLYIMGTDISHSVINKARDGRYNTTDVQRGLPEDLLHIYFRQQGYEWVLDESVKSMVDFFVFNLQSPFLSSWEKFDIIFLRNVIIYFSDPFKMIILDRIAQKLVPGGILFLGTGESVSGYTDRFQICDYRKAKFYRVRPS